MSESDKRLVTLTKDQCIAVALTFTAVVKSQIVSGNLPYTADGKMFKEFGFIKRFLISRDAKLARKAAAIAQAVTGDFDLDPMDVVWAIYESRIPSAIWVLNTFNNSPGIQIIKMHLPAFMTHKK